MTRSAILSSRGKTANRCGPFNTHAKIRRAKTSKLALPTFVYSFGSRPSHGRHGNNQISGEAQDVLCKLEESKVRFADPTTLYFPEELIALFDASASHAE